MPVASSGQTGTSPAAAKQQGAGSPPPVAQVGVGKEGTLFPPIKVGAMLEITDFNHTRVAPILLVEAFRIEQGPRMPIMCFDAGVADQAIMLGFGIRGIVPGADYFGVDFLMMIDFRPTIKYRGLGHKKRLHFCTGIGVTLAGF
jgi:hypothetical protein